MSPLELGFLSLVALISGIPFTPLLSGLRNAFRYILGKMDKAPERITMPKSQFIWLLSQALNILKGAIPIYIAGEFLNDLLIVYICIPIILILHHWPIVYRFKKTLPIILPAWGILIAIWPPNLLITPILFILLMLATNSPVIGLLTTLLTTFIYTLLSATNTYTTMSTTLLLLTALIIELPHLLDYFEGKKTTLFDLYLDRQ